MSQFRHLIWQNKENLDASRKFLSVHSYNGFASMYIVQRDCPHYRKELGFCTTFPFSCTYFCYNTLLTSARNTVFRTIYALLTHFWQFSQDRSLILFFWFKILLVVLENIYLEQMEGNEFMIFFFSQEQIKGRDIYSDFT